MYDLVHVEDHDEVREKMEKSEAMAMAGASEKGEEGGKRGRCVCMCALETLEMHVAVTYNMCLLLYKPTGQYLALGWSSGKYLIPSQVSQQVSVPLTFRPLANSRVGRDHSHKLESGIQD